VKQAYLSNDPLTAKDILLRWGLRISLSNLSRLAVRCPTYLQVHILRLDESLYSSSPVRWNEETIWTSWS